jgi:hypothetical protein
MIFSAISSPIPEVALIIRAVLYGNGMLESVSLAALLGSKRTRDVLCHKIGDKENKPTRS